jgi:hypothetical protein
MRFLWLACLLALGHTAEARPQSYATLHGIASFPHGPLATDRGTVSLIVMGLAESMENSCGTDATAFVAIYDGELVIEGDGSFSAALYPRSIVTADNCIVTSIRPAQVTAITIEAQVGDSRGNGWLTYQNLAAVDETELMAGEFGNLDGQLMF